MKPPVRPILALAAIAALGAFAYMRLSAPDAPHLLTGYIEGEAIQLAAPVPGRLAALHIERGQRVEPGAALFIIDTDIAAAQLAQAQAAADAAEARLRDAESGQRPEELAVIAAQRDAAQTRFEDALTELERVSALVARGALAQARRDQAQAAADTARASLDQVMRQYETAELGAREGQIDAARAESERAHAAVAEARLRLDQLAPTAPMGGRIENVYYQAGEWVAGLQPVAALLPDAAIKLRFFVAETDLPLYAPGTHVTFACDGCGAPRGATVTYVSPRPEFTPPVIYSRGSREKLVFLVEARPDAPSDLAPGQPIDVIPRHG